MVSDRPAAYVVIPDVRSVKRANRRPGVGPGEHGQRQRRGLGRMHVSHAGRHHELDPAGRVIDVLQPVDGSTHPRRHRVIEGHVSSEDCPARLRREGGCTRVGQAKGMVRVAWSDDVQPASLGDLDHRVTPRRGDALPLRDHAETVLTGHR